MSAMGKKHNNPPNVNKPTNNNNSNNNNNKYNVTEAIGQTREILYGQNSEPNRMEGHYGVYNTQGLANSVGQEQGQGQFCYTNYNPVQPSAMPMQPTFNQQGAFFQNPTPVNIAQSRQDNGIPPWAASLCQQMANIQSTLNGHTERWQSVENKITSQNDELLKMQAQMSELTKIKQNIESTNSKITVMQNEVKIIQSDVKDCDQTLKQYGTLYDDLVDNNCVFDKKLHELESKIESAERKQFEINARIEQTNERVTDLQWRSMRENLLFCGIRESENYHSEGENCEEIVKSFIRNDLEIDGEINLDRCHRIGRYRRDNLRPRPIVAKFTYFKDKERVKQAGQQKLKNTEFWVKDQYPKEMEEKRKNLYTVADEARKNKDNKVTLVRDRLYINGQLYRPDEQHTTTTQQQQQQQQRHNNRRWDTLPRNSNQLQWGRTFYRRSVPHSQPVKPNQIDTVAVSNRFSTLNSETPVNRESRKKKATSPLEDDSTFKKQHFGSSSSDSENEQSTILIEADVHESESQVCTQQPSDTSHLRGKADDEIRVDPATDALHDQPRDCSDSIHISREEAADKILTKSAMDTTRDQADDNFSQGDKA